MSYVINRPDPAAMGRLLDGHPCSALGAVLRLAWLEGLSREEIVGLTWPDLSMESREIRLKDRSVPFFGDMEDCLRERMRLHGRTSPHVVISEKFQQPLNPISVSRMMRRALDGAGMETVRLMDLRHDFVIRQLETTDWAAVARMSGLAVSMFQTVYAGYVQVRNPAKAPADGDNEYRIWRILQSEKGSTVGLALALRWYMDIQLNEMAALTWAQVDFAGNRLQLESRAVELAQSVRNLLLREYGRRGTDVRFGGLHVPNGLRGLCAGTQPRQSACGRRQRVPDLADPAIRKRVHRGIGAGTAVVYGYPTQ